VGEEPAGKEGRAGEEQRKRGGRERSRGLREAGGPYKYIYPCRSVVNYIGFLSQIHSCCMSCFN
jgi:hypothetical protein